MLKSEHYRGFASNHGMACKFLKDNQGYCNFEHIFPWTIDHGYALSPRDGGFRIALQNVATARQIKQ